MPMGKHASTADMEKIEAQMEEMKPEQILVLLQTQKFQLLIGTPTQEGSVFIEMTNSHPRKKKCRKELKFFTTTRTYPLLKGPGGLGVNQTTLFEEAMLFMAHVSLNSSWGLTPLGTMQ